MKIIPEVGDRVKIKGYSYDNKHGGTEIVNEEIIDCEIVHAFYDYECGWRYWGTPSDPYLLSRKDAHKPGKEDIVYFSQWKVLEVLN